ncbi:hypothetical protein [Trinickia acidisoli]|uniref:hypothetical protein n=1 Tax=Trinickia acidisoli TaxID=2767482 RepID=UPI001A8D31C3|nr:hypothetical protein [Trinickia acidisoli]
MAVNTSALSSGATVGSNASTIAEMSASTASSIALQDASTQMENQLNDDAAKDQLEEAGPKNAKSLTQG